MTDHQCDFRATLHHARTGRPLKNPTPTRKRREANLRREEDKLAVEMAPIFAQLDEVDRTLATIGMMLAKMEAQP